LDTRNPVEVGVVAEERESVLARQRSDPKVVFRNGLAG